MCSRVSFLTERSPERLDTQLGLVESFFLRPSPAWLFNSLGYIRGTVRQRLAPAASFALGEQRRGDGRRGGCKLRGSLGQRDKTGENQRKGTKQAAGCDRKTNTYNVQNSQALFRIGGNCSEVTVVILVQCAGKGSYY